MNRMSDPVEREATFARWAEKVRERLREGDATTAELRDHLGDDVDYRFFNWVHRQPFMERVGMRLGPGGKPNIVWRPR